jgi:ABC-type multidrug transport system fused ATPase/permease subunit
MNIKDINLHDLRQAISLVMQEPIIFNYSILENVLYGKTMASNDEVKNACVVANAMEFIDNNSLFSFDESAQGLITEMTKNMDQLVTLIGLDKFNEEMETLKKILEQENNKGDFEAIVGDVDNREERLKELQLCQGFQTQCGIKGGKLSGG